MSEKKLLFPELEGKDEFGKSKAVCAITIQHILSSDQVEIMDSANTAAQLCKKYLEMVRTSREKLALVLTVTPLGNYDYFITGVNGAWSLHAEKPYERSNVLRLMFVKECFGVYEVSKEAMEGMIEEAAMEL